MQSAKGAQTPYEVYCHHCRVTFPREARQCMHCGGRLSPPGRDLSLAAPASSAASNARMKRGGPEPTGEIDPEEELETGGLLLRRFGGLAVWALLALVAVLSRLCEQGG